MGMDSSSAAQLQHHQEIMSSQTLESMLVCSKSQQEKKPRPADQQTLKCPRCESTNTKFCYYNNYSLTQPRYFCKSCRRYWTKGGTLRNVPVGGGCRKNNKRSSSSASSSSTSSSSKRINQDQPITTFPSPIPCLGASLPYDANDLTLAIARLQKQTSGQLGLDDHDFSMWASQNVPRHHDGVLGNYSYLESTPPNGNIQNLYYGMGIGNPGMENGGMGIPYEELMSSGPSGSTGVTMVKEEIGNARETETRVLWGFPWQSTIGGDCDSGNMGECDSGRQSWNGIGSSNWQGLLNSPLM